MVSSPHLWFCARKTETLGPDLQVFMGTRHHLSFRACKTTWLEPEILVSMGSIGHLWFWMQNGDFWTKNNKSLWVPDLACDFVNAKSAPNIRIASLNGFQPPSVVFALKTATFGPELQVSMGPSSHLSSCECKTAWFVQEWQVYTGSSHNL